MQGVIGVKIISGLIDEFHRKTVGEGILITHLVIYFEMIHPGDRDEGNRFLEKIFFFFSVQLCFQFEWDGMDDPIIILTLLGE